MSSIASPRAIEAAARRSGESGSGAQGVVSPQDAPSLAEITATCPTSKFLAERPRSIGAPQLVASRRAMTSTSVLQEGRNPRRASARTRALEKNLQFSQHFDLPQSRGKAAKSGSQARSGVALGCRAPGASDRSVAPLSTRIDRRRCLSASQSPARPSGTSPSPASTPPAVLKRIASATGRETIAHRPAGRAIWLGVRVAPVRATIPRNCPSLQMIACGPSRSRIAATHGPRPFRRPRGLRSDQSSHSRAPPPDIEPRISPRPIV